MDEGLYKILLSKLEKGKCALFLGPEFPFTEQKGTELSKLLKKHFSDNNLKAANYLKEDGLFYKAGEDNTKMMSDRELIAWEVSSFFKNQSPHQYYDLLASLPFYLIISLSPDNFIEEAFKKINKPYEMLHYHNGDFYRRNKKNSKNFDTVYEYNFNTDDNSTIIINLCGTIDYEDSLVLTYDDFFKFLGPLMQGRDLKVDLKPILQKASSFIFLGFKYDKWYLNFIFYLLQQLLEKKYTETGKKCILYFTENEEENLNFYSRAYNFEFSKEDTNTFITEIYNRAKNKNLLFKPEQVTDKAVVRNDQNLEKFKIVYIAANPDDAEPVGSIKEYNAIKTTLRGHDKRDEFDLAEVEHAAKLDDLLNLFDAHHPNMVIISAHGTNNNELYFQDDFGDKLPLPIDQLQNVFTTLTQDKSSKLECVFFSCCHSDKLAETLSMCTRHAIGIEGVLPVPAAPKFTEAFFERFFHDRNFQEGFLRGELMLNHYIRNNPQYQNEKCIPRYFEQKTVIV